MFKEDWSTNKTQTKFEETKGEELGLVNKQDPDQVRRDQRRGAQTHRSKRMQELLQAPLHEHRRLQRVHAEEGAVQKVDAPLLGHHRQAQAERYQITVWLKLLMIK